MKKKILSSGAIIAICLFLFFSYSYFDRVDLSYVEVPDTIKISYPTQYNYRQSVNDCGPFNVAAVVRAVKKRDVDSMYFVQTMKWRLPNRYTLPFGLERQLKENDIAIDVPNVKGLPFQEKIDFLKESLSQERPVIILGGRDGYEHYITLVGYNQTLEHFHVYDSLHARGDDGYTVDDNGDSPGNVDMSFEELMHFWSEGGMYGFYRWYAITVQ